MQPALTAPSFVVRSRTAPRHLLERASGGDPALLVTRGPLAARAHRLLGLGALGAARLGQSQPALIRAFGSDVAGWQRVGTPWIAARSLARPVETLAGHSSAGWLLGQRDR